MTPWEQALEDAAKAIGPEWYNSLNWDDAFRTECGIKMLKAGLASLHAGGYVVQYAEEGMISCGCSIADKCPQNHSGFTAKCRILPQERLP